LLDILAMAQLDETWQPTEGLKTACHELNEAHEWLKATDVPIVTPMEEPTPRDEEGPKAPPKKKLKVAELDLIEHALMSGGWEGSGVVHKVGEIWIGVSVSCVMIAVLG